jgi:hypothetical protein
VSSALDINGSLIISSSIINALNTINIAGNWTNTTNGTFTANSSTVTFDGATSQTLSGNTTFYGLRATQSGATMYFTPGTTQYATNAVEFRNISLKSVTDNATWYFKYSGSSQTLKGLRVKDSNASAGSAMVANDGTSTDLGNNTNWVFAGDTGNRYWVASAPGNWSNAANWSYYSGGPGGYALLSTHTAVFDSGSVQISTIDAGFGGTISSVTINTGYTGTVYLTRSLTVSNTFYQQDGVIAGSTNTTNTTKPHHQYIFINKVLHLVFTKQQFYSTHPI